MKMAPGLQGWRLPPDRKRRLIGRFIGLQESALSKSSRTR